MTPMDATIARDLNRVFARMFNRAYDLRAAGDHTNAVNIIADVKAISDSVHVPISRRAVEGVDDDSPLKPPQFAGTREQMVEILSQIPPFPGTNAKWAKVVLWTLSAKLLPEAA